MNTVKPYRRAVLVGLLLSSGALLSAQESGLNPWRDQLLADAAAARASAACELGRLGFQAKPAIERLVSLLGDVTRVSWEEFSCGDDGHRSFGWGWDSRRRYTTPGREAARALSSIGNAALEPLVGVLSLPDASSEARADAVLGLGYLENESALEPLVA